MSDVWAAVPSLRLAMALANRPRARVRGKKRIKARKSASAKDLALGTRKGRAVKGGRTALVGGADIPKTPTPAEPVPTPYPN